MNSSSNSSLCKIDLVFLFLLLVALVAIFATVNDFGISWDEGVQAHYAESCLRYFLSCGSDKEALSFLDTYLYSPTFDLFAAVCYQNFPAFKFEIRHALTALFSLASSVALYGLLRNSQKALAGLAAVTGLLLLPQFVGHSFLNSKDAPLASAMIFMMFALNFLFTSKSPVWIRMLMVALSQGLCLSIRPGILPIVIAFDLLSLLFAFCLRKSSFPLNKIDWRYTLPVLIACWCLMICCWPWAQQNIVKNPVSAMSLALNFHTVYPVLFEGHVYQSSGLPWYYLVKQILITIPLTVLILSAVGIVMCLYRLRFSKSPAEQFLSFQALMWILLPVIFWSIFRPAIYNGARHFLFVMPSFALLSGIAAESIWFRLRETKLKSIAAVGLVLLLIFPAISVVESHPYQNIFYNGIVASSSGAQGQYELEYTASTYKEGMEWIRVDALRSGKKNPHVLVAGNGYLLEALGIYSRNDVLYRIMFAQGVHGDLPDDCDYYLSTVQNDFHKNFDQAATVFSIKRSGAVLAVIKIPAKKAAQKTSVSSKPGLLEI